MDLCQGWEFTRADWLADPPTYVHHPGWLPARTPGSVHLDLVANGVIAHPFQAIAEAGCDWVDEADWSYRNRFEWSRSSGRDRIRFEGLDTVCEIFLNGAKIGSHDNMFLPLEIDASEALTDGANELRIDFQSALRVGRERRSAYFAAHGIPTDVKNFDERAFVRKAQYMFGWDWGPRLVSCGIWKPVRLVGGDRDAQETLVRARRATLLREADAFGESFEFEVDGGPAWMRGANWIPIHSFPSESSAIRSRLEDARALGCNMLRVWGGGLYESDEFYDLCDELGILVWQDFPFACSYYPDDDAFVEAVRAEASFHVRRLRRHPCLALWCGNNENLTMWEGKWGGADRNPDRFHGEKLWNEVLAEVVQRLDPGRPYIPTSPIGSPPGESDCNSGGYGDSHYWDVWHGRGDWVHYRDSTARFSSEFGFPSACGERAWAMVTSAAPSTLGPDEPIVLAHDKTGRPHNYLRDLIGLHYPESRTLEDWIYFGQLNQRDAMRAAIEHYRRSDFCKGALIWQLNDCWPAQSWSLIDVAGDWKAAAYELPRLYADVLVCLDVSGKRADLWAVNDSRASVLLPISLRILDSVNGASLRTWRESCHLDAGERRIVHSHDVSSFDPHRTLLVASGAGADTVRLLVEPKDLYLSLPVIRATAGEDGRARISADTPVLDLWFSGSDSLQLLGAPLTVDRLPHTKVGQGLRSLAGLHEFAMD